MNLTRLPDPLAIVRLTPDALPPVWAFLGPFASLTRTPEELSIVCAQEHVPEGIPCDRNWRALKVAGPLDLALVGVLASIAEPLADADISLFAVSTYDTDYVLVKAAQLEEAVQVLQAAGHTVTANESLRAT